MSASAAATQDVVLGARQMLATVTGLTALLGSDPKYVTWIFQDQLHAVIENSQTCAVVLTLEPSWMTNDSGTTRFPRLGVTIYADPKRDSNNNLTNDDTRTKVLAVFQQLDKVLHRPSNETVLWGDLRIIGSKRLNEPVPNKWTDSDRGVSAQVFYAVTVG